MANITSTLLEQMECPECGERNLRFAVAQAIAVAAANAPAPNIVCPDCEREFLQESPKLQDQRHKIVSGLRTVEVRTDLRSLQYEMERLAKHTGK
jgi:hypothetical protein